MAADTGEDEGRPKAARNPHPQESQKGQRRGWGEGGRSGCGRRRLGKLDGGTTRRWRWRDRCGELVVMSVGEVSEVERVARENTGRGRGQEKEEDQNLNRTFI